MTGKKISSAIVLRAAIPYPAVFIPTDFGGTEVVFPNFPGAKAFGINADLAVKAAVEELTLQLYMAIKNGSAPTPSKPERLLPDDEEPSGTRIVMVEPDSKKLLERFGLLKNKTGNSGRRH